MKTTEEKQSSFGIFYVCKLISGQIKSWHSGLIQYDTEVRDLIVKMYTSCHNSPKTVGSVTG